MNRARALTLLARLHDAQNSFYGGGDSAPLGALLTPDVTWMVPGQNAIAGTYRGIEQVLGYFARRRDLASATFRLHRRDVLVGDGNQIVAITDGTATIAGQPRAWSTLGLYEASADKIAACRLLPLDQAEFDAIWSGRAAGPGG
jgi:ketosteroid isomerase-like protein